MIIKSLKSKLSVVNLFADFLLSKIPHDEESIIQVIDCENFFLIKGKTTHNEPLNLSEIKSEFEKFGKNFVIRNTIDLIEYDCEITKKDKIFFNYYNSDNCSYSNIQLNSFEENNSNSYNENPINNKYEESDNLVWSSSFPHGYSLGQGRLLYYYGKHIVYNIPVNYIFESITLEISNKKNEDGDTIFHAYDNLTNTIDKVLTSAILDVFDFDMSWLEKELRNVEWFVEITNPIEDYEFLKRRVKDFIII